MNSRSRSSRSVPVYSTLLYIWLACFSGVCARQLSSRQLNAIQFPITFEPEPSPEESVPDNRTLVTDTTVFPYNTIGLIQVLDQSGEVQGLCSGALIGPNIVLTAAHCILDPDTGTATTAATFTPAYNPKASNPAPYGVAGMQNWEIPQAFSTCVKKSVGGYDDCEQNVDFGLMLLNTTFDQHLSYGINSSNIGDQVVSTAGYPGDEGTCANFQTTGDDSGCAMYQSTCTDAATEQGVAYDTFPCYGYEGQSGSPIWLQDPATGNSTVIGVLTSGDAEDGEAFTILSQKVYSQLQAYIKQLTSSSASPSPMPATA